VALQAATSVADGLTALIGGRGIGPEGDCYVGMDHNVLGIAVPAYRALPERALD
jgi:hypothetical protein